MTENHDFDAEMAGLGVKPYGCHACPKRFPTAGARLEHQQTECYADGIVSNVTIGLDWRDRIRVLFRGQMRLTVHNFTEHEVGRVRTETSLYVPPIRPQRAQTQGMAEWNQPTVKP